MRPGDVICRELPVSPSPRESRYLLADLPRSVLLESADAQDRYSLLAADPIQILTASDTGAEIRSEVPAIGSGCGSRDVVQLPDAFSGLSNLLHRWRMPPPTISRAVLLEVAAELGIATEERGPTEEELLAAEEVVLSSSLRGVVPVVVVDGHEIGNGRPGERFRELAHGFRSVVEQELGL